MNKKQQKILLRIIISALLTLAYVLLKSQNWLKVIIYLLAYGTIGYDILKKALKGLLNHEVFDENFLMTIATLGAIGLGEYTEGIMVMMFYQIGELFQSVAVRKSRQNIISLMDIRPDYAWIENEKQELIKVDPTTLKIGETIIVKVGDKIPVDGIVIEGDSTLNTSALTGETKPKDIYPGDEIISGSINMSAPLKIETTRLFEDSTVSRILDLVENAAGAKSKSENFISKFAHYYTPVVVYSALALCLLPPLFNLIIGHPAAFSTWLYRALTFLVISCPCALVISIPLSFFGAIGGASNKGILIKGSNYLETLAKARCVAFDKTGTMTKGVFVVTGLHHVPISEKYVLKIAAYAEFFSNHPIAKSIIKAYGQPLNKELIESIREYPGKGIKAKIDGQDILVGNEKFFKENNISYIPCRSVGTIVHVSENGEYMGHIVITDIVKNTSAKTIQALKEKGLYTIMLTGDNRETANQVAKEITIDKVNYELLPEDKVNIVKELISTYNHKLIFVGDGINDAPVISLSDIGISMGALGSDAAIEAADIVLMDDDPYKVVTAINIARKCMRIVYENIYGSIGIKVICLLLTALGITNMWLAIFADVGVMIIAVINAIRTMKVDL